MIGGYIGKMLFVDLTAGIVEDRELTAQLAQNFLGGYGLGAKILYEMMPAGPTLWVGQRVGFYSWASPRYKGIV